MSIKCDTQEVSSHFLEKSFPSTFRGFFLQALEPSQRGTLKRETMSR